MRQFLRACAGLLALSMCFQATAQTAKSSLTPDQIASLNALWSDESNMLNSVPWPVGSDQIGFKAWTIGADFDLDGPLAYSYALPQQESGYVLEHFEPSQPGRYRATPYKCHLEGEVAVFQCIAWLSNVRGLPADLVGVNTAFSEEVNVTLEVLPRMPVAWSRIESRHFGVGRIQSVRIENPHASQEYVQRATEFFNAKFSTQPTMETKLKEAGQVMSKDCVESLQRINKKPVNGLSAEDISTKNSCEAQAAMGQLAQKDREVKTTTRTWKGGNGNFVVTVADLQIKDAFVRSVYGSSYRQVVILIDHPIGNRLAAMIKAFNDSQATQQTKQSRADF